MVFSPNSFRGAPVSHLATLTFPDGGTAAEEGALIRAVAQDFPMVTSVRVKEALEAIGAVVANLLLAIRGASAVTLIAAALVLGGALAAGHRSRVYDAVILKTLGATRARLIGAYATEYLLLGAASALFGVFERLARQLADRGRSHAPALCLAALAGAGRGAGGAHRDGLPRPRRHFLGAGAETGTNIKEFIGFLRHSAA